VKIDVHIERLVLEGLPVTSLQGPLVQQAIERELARLLGAHGLSHELRHGAALPRVRAGALRLARENPPARLGLGIARAVHEGIGSPIQGGGKR